MLPVPTSIKATKFEFLTSKEIADISVVTITNPNSYDTLGNAVKGGLYDPKLGPIGKSDVCETCGLGYFTCPGHWGKVDVSLPVYHPILFPTLYKLLRMTCSYCHKLRIKLEKLELILCMMELYKRGLLQEANDLFDKVNKRTDLGKGESTAEDEDDMDVDSDSEELSDLIKEYSRHLDLPVVKNITLTSHLKQLEKSFYSSVTANCPHCKVPSATIRKDGYYKLFKKPLPVAVKKKLIAKGIHPDLPLNKEDVKDIMSTWQDIEQMERDEPETVASESESEAESEQVRDSDSEITPTTSNSKDQFLTTLDVLNTMKQLWHLQPQVMKAFFPPMEAFFVTSLAVPPTKFRPPSKLGDMNFDHPQNTHLNKILTLDNQIRTLKETSDEKRLGDNLIRLWLDLQLTVNALMDSTKANSPTPGIRQLLEKKEGLFRKHMMGKRVNYAARSVISPDVQLEQDEIGVPPFIATKLTYPTPVTPHNVAELRQAVINGSSTWPGATSVQNEDGSIVQLANLDKPSRIAVANTLLSTTLGSGSTPKIVHRHVLNGDLLLLNRQPTLHKPSMMVHAARILTGEKTLRMHYANCNTYNADFDGDEMNLHFPQNEIARAESMIIAKNDRQYLVPTSGGVLRGLIQDHVDAGVHLTNKDTFLTREEYTQILYVGLRCDYGGGPGSTHIEDEVVLGKNGRIELLPPTILKPVPLWTGKQVISTLLLNLLPFPLNLESTAKTPSKYWGSIGKEEADVIFAKNELLTGIMDKNQFGASANGVVHAIYEVYGPRYAGKLLSIFSRLFSGYLQFRGFTCGMDDLILTQKGDEIRRDLLSNVKKEGMEVAEGLAKSRDVEEIDQTLEHALRNDEELKQVDAAFKTKMNSLTSKVVNTCLPAHLVKVFPENNMQTMTVAGAKGSNVNVSQISCCLGQQELEGRRVPIMTSGKSLPSFVPYDTDPMAGGYIAGRFLTGIKPQEYYFHCMAGREGLIDTAVKTSRSGYLQRCLIKHLEGLTVAYDNTVRDADGSVVQFYYGEDGLDITKQKSLDRFSLWRNNFPTLMAKLHPAQIVQTASVDSSGVAEKHMLKRLKKPEKYPDTTMSRFVPTRYLGSTSEKFAQELKKYVEGKDFQTDSVFVDKKISPEKFTTLMNLKYMTSLVEPGEAVGVLAGQGIGEPSTQMTLNTFHFAGFGAANVTLGIPRLRELLMTASAKIKTPLMTLPLQPGRTDKQVEKLCKDMTRLNLASMVENVTVSEALQVENHERKRIYTLEIQFWPPDDCLQEYNVKTNLLSYSVESSFLPLLEKAMDKDLKAAGEQIKSSKVKASKEPRDEDDDTAAEPSIDLGSDEESVDSEDEDRADKELERGQDYNNDQENSSESEDERDEEGLTEHDRVMSGSKYVSSYNFSSKSHKVEIKFKFSSSAKKILLLALAESALKRAIVRQVPGIQKVYPVQNEASNDPVKRCASEGCNLQGVWQHASHVVDLEQIYTNDIVAILKTYGVEAAREAIIKEMASVFGAYGIGVDRRHLSLIADYMTFEGGYKPFNRMGMNTNTSPFAQMSFETTMQFLTSACMTGDFDDLKNPSARIVMGQVVKGGTGGFDIISPTTLH